MPNRLAEETSPYLIQHAFNPVDWFPWGPEAFSRAKLEDKPILLSVGYSACHWCHVMERESFEDPAIANLMNDNFVCIKVDREERPDVDSIYMSAVQAITGQGGWPMTVFLTPNGEPFYGGTYFPPEDRGGLPAFPRVLEALSQTYREKREEISLTTDKLLEQMRRVTDINGEFSTINLDVMDRAVNLIGTQFDEKFGGFGLQPKFPQPMVYEFLLRHYLRTGDNKTLEIVETTLDHMAMGGIYDQLGGGFHRYSTDTFWLVPHFEKMLYDNALLARLYIHAYQVTEKPLYRQIAEETLDYVLAEMTDPSGGFYSAQDADSEGEEGKFFVWRPEKILEVLGKHDGEIANRYFGVTIEGNFDGMSILNVKVPLAEFAAKEGITEDDLIELLNRVKSRLRNVREQRIRPGLDDKVLTSWNALMMGAFAEAGRVLDRTDYIEAAENCGDLLLSKLRTDDGRLLRTYKNGESKLKGYLEDYAFLVNALLLLHEATFESRWLCEAIELGNDLVDLFWDDNDGQFYDTGIDHEELVLRPRAIQDNAIPSGNSMATEVLLKLAIVTGDAELERRSITAIRSTIPMISQFPISFGHWLCSLDFCLASVKEIAVIGDARSIDTKTLTAEVFRNYLPNKVLVSRNVDDEAIRGLPLLSERVQVGNRPTAYVCHNYACEIPVNQPDELARQLID